MPSTLLICSGGGHLKQLFELADRVGIPPAEQTWITFRNGLSQTLLADRDVQFVPFAGPRDGHSLSAVAMVAHAMLRQRRFDLAISTGSGPGAAVLPQTASAGISSHYIESAARADGPSLSGRLVSKFPRVHTYTQYRAWSSRRWHYRGSIFDSFAQGVPVLNDAIRKVVVTVGTQDGYPFPRLFRSLVPQLHGREVLWQAGETPVRSLGIEGRSSVPHNEMRTAIAEADVIVSHAGCGSAITAIEAGKCPILVPRLLRHGEHIDDHQLQIAKELDRRGLAIMAHVEELDESIMLEASRRSTMRVPAPQFWLDDVAPMSRHTDDDLVPAAL
jgi:UDP-N-acetylglucosamine--N-acetylmuramyl-(pentapeptide) pyrophosphoryl-undecaprenol N-acetylglucosamine transferase